MTAQDEIIDRGVLIPDYPRGGILRGAGCSAMLHVAVLMAGCALTIPTGLLLAPMLSSGSLVLIWAFLSLALLFMGLAYGPVGAYIPGLFPARVRYTGASMGLNVAGIIGGALTPILAQALATRGGLVLVGVYLSTAALVGFIALIFLGRNR